MTEAEKKMFKKNIVFLRENVNRLSYPDKKFFFSIVKQMKFKTLDRFTNNQYNRLNEIARRMKRKSYEGKTRVS